MGIAQNFRDKKIVHTILCYKFELILLFLTIIGLVLKFFYLFRRLDLNSDSVYAGLVAIEFSKYHNYFLSYYYVPSADPFTFELVVFHLLPQILSNFNPVMLKIIAFFYLLLTVIIFSCIVFFSTKNLLNTLFFSALLSNWYTDYGITSHESTIFMIGILLILYLFKPIKHWDIIFLIILGIVTFSDSLVIIWFTIPILFTILINNLSIINLSNRSHRPLMEKITSFLKIDLVVKIIFLSSIVMIFKKFIEYYASGAYIQCIELGCLIKIQIPALFKDLPSSLSLGLYRIENNQITFIDVLFVIFLIVYTILLIKNFKQIPKKDILIYVGIMFVVTSIFYLIVGVPGSSLRYLKFILIGLLLISCMTDFNKPKYIKWLLLSIIIINLIYVIDIPFNNHPPNEEQYQLIDFLKKSNLSFGYGEYWDSNIITYLSHEDVTIRPVLIQSGLKPYYWLSAKRWYENPPKNFFVIVKDNDEKALNYYYNNYVPKPIQIIDYKNYKIFVYNISLQTKIS